jgi:sugar/nucleoside kinase (ribokinase family)
MSVLVVGSVALDSVETPFGRAEDVLGGSATFFAASASHLTKVSVVGVVGSDFPVEKLEPLTERGVDFSGLEQAEGKSFRWRGRYRHDLNAAETLETHLGVFSHFSPKIPVTLQSHPYVFLANIDPRLQLDVLKQVAKPRLIACDTMNFWIQSRRPDIIELLKHVDLMTLNDSEARQLTEKANLVQAAQWILARGPRHVIIKKGEHGAYMFTSDSIFFAPAFPLENVFDPTGAGDAFAGGFIGYLAATGDLAEANLRRAVIYGSVMGSFAVEKFSIERLTTVTREEINQRMREMRRLVTFEEEIPA